jgi:hypothetical protein
MFVHNEVVRNLKPSPNKIRAIKSRGMILEGYVAGMGRSGM